MILLGHARGVEAGELLPNVEKEACDVQDDEEQGSGQFK
jgi:hypothetical protein